MYIARRIYNFLSLPIAQLLSADPPPPPYGHYMLQEGDNDDRLLYEGSVRSAANGDNVPESGQTPYVQQLQQDLIDLGFKLVGTPDGDFGLGTVIAVREFQIYAKMDNLAEEMAGPWALNTPYSVKLTQVPNTEKYVGKISGMVNSATRARIRIWIVKKWRCPVVLAAYRVTNDVIGGIYNNHENIWKHDEVRIGEIRANNPNIAARIYARDFTGYYTFPPGQNANDLIALGFYERRGPSGPVSKPPNYAWPEAELLEANFTGSALPLSPTVESTFKVIRAVSEVENFGFFDSVNAWDSALISLGPCHWTLRLGNSGGELGGYFSYLKYNDLNAFEDALGFFGLHPKESWLDHSTASSGKLLFQANRTYLSDVQQETESSTNSTVTLSNAGQANSLKTWHWFYRYVMAGRTIPGFQNRMYDMARIRVRDILNTNWGTSTSHGNTSLLNVSDGTVGGRPPRIGDVFTSEQAVAMVLRWHIRYPGHVINGSGPRAANSLRRAVSALTINPLTAPDTWGNTEEAQLITGIVNRVNAIVLAAQAVYDSNPNNTNEDKLNTAIKFRNTMTYVRDWHQWNASSNRRNYSLNPGYSNLDNTRNSFDFDSNGLLNTPYPDAIF